MSSTQKVGVLSRRSLALAGARRMLRDMGYVQTSTPGPTNAYGYSGSGETYTDGTSIPLHYVPQTTEERGATVTQVATIDATVYLPLETKITARDRIVITHQNGRLLPEPLVCTVKSEPMPDVVTLAVLVQTVIEHA